MPLWKRLMIRPEFGASPAPSWCGSCLPPRPARCGSAGRARRPYLDSSALYGLSAVAIGLLMIGGEFDLSSG
jgi:hypothetical protein